MTDDWGVDSHTVELRYRWSFGTEQLPAAARALLPADRGGLLSHRAVQRRRRCRTFATADHRLGEFDGLTFGVKYGQATARGGEWSARLEYYTQTGEPRAGLGRGSARGFRSLSRSQCIDCAVQLQVRTALSPPQRRRPRRERSSRRGAPAGSACSRRWRARAKCTSRSADRATAERVARRWPRQRRRDRSEVQPLSSRQHRRTRSTRRTGAPSSSTRKRRGCSTTRQQLLRAQRRQVRRDVGRVAPRVAIRRQRSRAEPQGRRRVAADRRLAEGPLASAASSRSARHGDRFRRHRQGIRRRPRRGARAPAVDALLAQFRRRLAGARAASRTADRGASASSRVSDGDRRSTPHRARASARSRRAATRAVIC